MLAAMLMLLATPQVSGPDAARCAAGGGPAMLVSITGLRDRGGTVRVRSFGGSPSTYFNKKRALQRTEIATPPSGPVRICMPVSAQGWYAVDVRHDTNSNGDTDRADGGGASGNPSITLIDVLFGRKPPAEKVRVWVGAGVTTVPITVKYLQGGSFKPVGQ
jgi:uncharacterized protein (DUF2141 family)